MERRGSESKNSRNDDPRGRRLVLAMMVFLVVALIATQVFLHQTSVGSPRFVHGTLLLWSATVLVVVAILVLATVFGRNLIRLYFDRRVGQLGSRFRTRMVSMTVVLSLLPAVLLFLLSYGLINFSIEQWFSAPAVQMMENSRAIAEQYYDETNRRSRHSAETLARGFETIEQVRPERLEQLEAELAAMRRSQRLDNVRLYDHHGNLTVESGQRVSLPAQSAQVRALVSEALRGKAGSVVARISPGDALREVAWGWSAAADRDGRVIGAVLTELLIPQSVQFKAYSVMEAFGVYQELERNKAALRLNVLIILALSTLLIIFVFSWFAMYLSKRITVPIQALAEGAEAVAAGDLDYRVECEAIDELGNLVSSFNVMTGELKENKARIEAARDELKQTNVELDDRRRYIETILQTIATGVISLDGDYRIRTMNRAAMQMLDVPGPVNESPLEEAVQSGASGPLKTLLHKSSILGPVARTIELVLPTRTLHLATTVTPLVDGAGRSTGWVVVLDDVSELLRAEKMAAWQEVARRLAHEIKNPLTPIQLSAERLLMRYRGRSGAPEAEPAGSGSAPADAGSFGSLLEESVRTITAEASSLKNLVDEFSQFARLPEVRLEEADLHRVLENTLGLYNGRIEDVSIVREFDASVPTLRLDAEQMKRVFVNLLDNALEAMAGSARPRVLRIRTSCNRTLQLVRVEISDTGRGFPKEYQDSLFLPYFSTRKDGTGLGLAIVRQIISDHSGYVRAEPNSPVGTRIVIDLPLASS